MEESDDEWVNDGQFHFWKNWVPAFALPSERMPEPCVKRRKVLVQNTIWIPPVNFESFRSNHEAKVDKAQQSATLVQPEIHTQHIPNLDWGMGFNPFLKLSDVEDDNLVWINVNPGIFSIFKLHVNKYDNVIFRAEAEFNRSQSEEKCHIFTTNGGHLRKILAVPCDEWSALVDTVSIYKEQLFYTTSHIENINNLRPVEQLWSCLCQRRLNLPTVSIRLKRCGEYKCTQFLRFMPKFVVEDVRTFDGREIS